MQTMAWIFISGTVKRTVLPSCVKGIAAPSGTKVTVLTSFSLAHPDAAHVPALRCVAVRAEMLARPLKVGHHHIAERNAGATDLLCGCV